MTGALGAGTYTYTWEQSPDNFTWTTASGIATSETYATPVLTDTITILER